MTRHRTIIAFALLFGTMAILAQPGALLTTARAQSRPPVVLRGENVAIEAAMKDGSVEERYLARNGDRWIEVATSGRGQAKGPVSVIAAGATSALPSKATAVSLEGGTLVEQFTVGPHRVIRHLMIDGDGSWIRVVTRFEPAGRASLHQLFDRLRFSHRAEWSFAPSVGGFVPDAQYKAPLILVQNGRVALGIVPDLAVLHRSELERCNHTLDLDVPGGPELSVGFLPARFARHSVYAADPARTWNTDAAVENAYYVLLTAAAEPGQAYRQAVRWHWNHFGRAQQATAAAQQAGVAAEFRGLTLWDEWRKAVWQQESPRRWLAVPLPDGSTGGGVETIRWGGPRPSVYLSAWFNSLRTSYGMALYARRTGDKKLLALARQTVELALKSPGHDGAMKCIAVPADKGAPTVWAAGDGCGASIKDGFLGYDMCWTGYWLLRWRASQLPGSADILPRCERLAQFMIARQAADGMLPTRFAEDGSVDQELSRTVKAETGPVALFLLELYQQHRDPRCLAAALQGLDFLQKNVIPQRQWYDFETFFSCSPRTITFDARSGQWPANNLALGQTVAAYLAAYRATGQQRYLAKGESLLDYLLLYQQCWTNPVLNALSCPTMLLGGFTTQNSDAEWSDARQSQCGNILLDYYRATGKVEYLERGVAALRAQFPVSPSENWAHCGYGGGNRSISSFHWGQGSGMAGIEIDEDFLRDAIVDVAAGRGVGVNGLNLTQCTVRDGRIELTLSSPFAWQRNATVVFRHAEPDCRYRLFINGADLGERSGVDLGRGIAIRPER